LSSDRFQGFIVPLKGLHLENHIENIKKYQVKRHPRNIPREYNLKKM